MSIPAWLVDVLAEHIATHPGDDDLIFTAPARGPIRRTSFRTRFWKPAVRSSVGDPCRFHDLRHTHVALLIEQGAHPSVIASRLGHTSVRTVLDVYGHLFEGLDRDIADSLEPPSDAPRAYFLPTSGQERGHRIPNKIAGTPYTARVSGRGRYWDRTSDLCRVEGSAGATRRYLLLATGNQVHNP